jgi:hypothetical protein
MPDLSTMCCANATVAAVVVSAVVSDAGCGGQVLLDSVTFSIVKGRLEELGQVRRRFICRVLSYLMCSILSYHILPYLSYLIYNISSCLNISHLYCMLSKQHDCIVHFEPCGWKGTAHAARLLDQRKVGSSLARSGSPALAADTYYSNASWHARATTAMWAGLALACLPVVQT